jgi:Glyoxalase-like domain
MGQDGPEVAGSTGPDQELDGRGQAGEIERMHLRQIALVARQLEPVVDDLTAVLGLEVAFHDPGVEEFGLRNAVLPVGETFLEVVAPIRAEATAARFLERRGGDGGYMAIFQTGDLAGDRARLARLGMRVVWEVAFPDIATVHLHPRDLGGAIVSLDEPRPAPSWRWAGPEWKRHVRTDLVRAIVGVEVQSEDPVATRERWAGALGARASDVPAAAGAIDVALDGGRVRFSLARDGRGPGIAAVRLLAVDAEGVRARARSRGRLDAAGDVVIGGVRLELADRP